MNEQAGSCGPNQQRTIEKVRGSLPRRYARERRFRLLGRVAVVLGLSFVAILFLDIVLKGYTAFQQTYIELAITFDPEVIDPEGTRDPQVLARANYQGLIKAALRERFPSVSARRERRALNSLVSPGAPVELRRMVLEDPGLIGTTRPVWLLADDDVDMLVKGKSTPLRPTPGAGIASVTGTEGEIQVISTVNEFSGILREIKGSLDRSAARRERELARIEGRLERARDQLAEVRQEDDQATREAAIAEAEEVLAKLTAEAERMRSEINALRAGASGGE